MSISPGDAFTSHNFGLQIDGVMVEYLAEVNGLTIEQDVIKYLSNSAQGKPEVSLMPGTQKDGQCTVVRGMTPSASFTSGSTTPSPAGCPRRARTPPSS